MKDIAWFTPNGHEMTGENWGQGFAKCIGVFLNGEAIPSPNARGERILDDSFYLIFNGHSELVPFTLPDSGWGSNWVVVFATNELKFPENGRELAGERL